MIDETIARKMNTVTEFGARFDTAADFVFVVVCLIKLLPVISMPAWLCIWIVIIALIKIINIISGHIVQRKLVAVHSVMNKVTGVLLFILPLIQVITLQTMMTPKNRKIRRMTTVLKMSMRKIFQMKRVMRNKDNGLSLFITSAACMSRSMSGMGSELIGGTLKPKYHSDSAGRRGVMWNRKQNRIIKIRKTTLSSSAVLRS